MLDVDIAEVQSSVKPNLLKRAEVFVHLFTGSVCGNRRHVMYHLALL